MALEGIPNRRPEVLIRAYLSRIEDAQTATLIERLRTARKRGYLTPSELEAVCYWKAARAIHHIRANSARQVRKATRGALQTRSERRRLEELVALRGVSVPMASAILMLLDPRRYGVIDIRVWQLLHALGRVRSKPEGVGFDFGNWLEFLMIIRDFAKKFGVSARDIERTLFSVHQRFQRGPLYKGGSRRKTVQPRAAPPYTTRDSEHHSRGSRLGAGRTAGKG
jgi:hypothetical protein